MKDVFDKMDEIGRLFSIKCALDTCLVGIQLAAAHEGREYDKEKFAPIYECLDKIDEVIESIKQG